MPEQKKERKREKDRQSGTGRGKEVSKGGAGGKYTWGSLQMILRTQRPACVKHLTTATFHARKSHVNVYIKIIK